jgi:tRNA A58 N-methylase Trm61
MTTKIAQGDFVLLRAAGGREYFASVRDEKLHTDLGTIDIQKLEGLEWGSVVESHLGKPFIALRPRAPDFFKHIRRTGAPMMPKDIGAIIAHGYMPFGCRPGCRHRLGGAGHIPWHHSEEGHLLRD